MYISAHKDWCAHLVNIREIYSLGHLLTQCQPAVDRLARIMPPDRVVAGFPHLYGLEPGGVDLVRSGPVELISGSVHGCITGAAPPILSHV